MNRALDARDEYHWTTKSPRNYFNRYLWLVGRAMDELLFLYFITTVGNGPKNIGKPDEPVRVVGTGQTGILAAYAALFEPSIKEVVVIDPPKSHKDGPHFLNVLRVLDIPEALGLLAPTPLTIIGGNDAAFDRTAEIYRLAGAEDKIEKEKNNHRPPNRFHFAHA